MLQGWQGSTVGEIKIAFGGWMNGNQDTTGEQYRHEWMKIT